MKLLIIRSGALGDTLMLMPLISALSEEHEIIVLGRKPSVDYLEPYVKQCIDIERGGWHKLFTEKADGINAPEAESVIAFINDNENIVTQNLKLLFPDAAVKNYPPFPETDSCDHVAFYMARAAQSSGIPVDPAAAFDNALNNPLMPSNREAAKNILLHPGSGSKKKNYSPDFWFHLLDRIKNSGPSFDICFLLGPAEEDIFPIIEKKAGKYDVKIICPVGEELITALNNTQLYIGHDSGVTHLAAMSGINTIALFKNSSISQWRPLGPFVKIIEPGGNEEDILKTAVGETISFFK